MSCVHIDHFRKHRLYQLPIVDSLYSIIKEWMPCSWSACVMNDDENTIHKLKVCTNLCILRWECTGNTYGIYTLVSQLLSPNQSCTELRTSAFVRRDHSPQILRRLTNKNAFMSRKRYCKWSNAVWEQVCAWIICKMHISQMKMWQTLYKRDLWTYHCHVQALKCEGVLCNYECI